MHRKNRTPLLVTTLLSAAISTATAVSFSRWKKTRAAALRESGRITATAHGPVAYSFQPGPHPESPVVLLTHGAPGGHDQGFLLSRLTADGFALLTPSRPGYLHTPLQSGRTPAEQADLFAALLDALHIEKVAILGMSAGGPIALQFALRHPDRTWGLMMEAGVSQSYLPPESANESILGRLFLNDTAQELLMWLFTQFTWLAPAPALKEMLRVESRFDQERLERVAAAIMARPEQVRWFQQLTDTTAPMSLRKAGLENDLSQLRRLPIYPLAQIELPTLVMHSLYDNDAPFGGAQFVAETIPGAELFTVDAAGHFLWLGEDADLVYEKRLAFLREHQP